MINTILKNEVKNKLPINNIISDVYLLPRWEKIISFNLMAHRYFFKKEILNVGLYRKFSAKNQLEKYAIKTENGKILASADLKVYKDSVYIISLDANLSVNFNKLVEYLLQTALEKALYNTSEKEVYINIESGKLSSNIIKKILLLNEFQPTENQSDLEKKMFGETFYLKISNNSKWNKKIKEFPILINK